MSHPRRALYMKRVLILNANQRSALAVTRSLGNHKVPLIAADETTSALAGSSRYSQHYYSYPSPQLHPEQFSSAISDICIKENIDIVIPMTELTATLLINKQSFLQTVTLPFADINTINTLADKCSLMQLAETLNIPTPRTWYANDPANLPIDLSNISYPLVLKPGKSWLIYNNKWIHTTVKVAHNAEEADSIISSDPAFAAYPFMLQEYIPGKGEGVFAIYNNSNPLAFFAHRRLREKPPQGGVSVLSESVAVDSALETYARKLLGHVNWHGVAMVEFRVTTDGKPYLMEINTRFWGSLQLAIDSGIDFPWLLYQIASGKQPKSIDTYITGVRLRWILGDLDTLYLILRDRTISISKKLKAILTFLQPHPFKTRHEVNRLQDIKPFWWELKSYLRDILK